MKYIELEKMPRSILFLAFWSVLILMTITSCQSGQKTNSTQAQNIELDTLNLNSSNDIELYSLITANSNLQSKLEFEIVDVIDQYKDGNHLIQVSDNIVNQLFPEMDSIAEHTYDQVFYYSYLPLETMNGVFFIERLYDNNPSYYLTLILFEDWDKIISQTMVASNISYPGGTEKSGSKIVNDTIFTFSMIGWPKEHPIKTGRWYAVYDSINTRSQIMKDGSIVPLSYYDSTRIDKPK